MDTPTLDAQIGALKDLRLDAASRSRDLALRELDGRLLRLQIEGELMEAGKSATAAERVARGDERYVVWERETARLGWELHRVEAEAEAASWGLRLQVVVLERVGI